MTILVFFLSVTPVLETLLNQRALQLFSGTEVSLRAQVAHPTRTSTRRGPSVY
jgi:hypothetical protein